jgi:uncharacterized membrane protein
MSNQVTETQVRTISKLVIYKIISIVVSYFLSLAFGANTAQAVTMSLVALTIGSLHYYLYDRLWLFIPWRREEGNDSTLRSIVKTIVYRITVIIVIMITARVVFLDSNWEAFIMASIKFCTHAVTYFTLERVFNRISWGKIKKETV